MSVPSFPESGHSCIGGFVAAVATVNKLAFIDHAKDGEDIMFNWVEWADKPTRGAAMEKMMKDERMHGLMPLHA